MRLTKKNKSVVLKDKLTELKKKGYKHVKITAYTGSSFFYANKLSNETISDLRKLDKYYRTKNEKNLVYKKNKIKTTKSDQERKELAIQIEALEKTINIPLLEREVIEVYKGVSPDEPKTKIIVIDGTEKGPYWTIKEYRRANYGE